MSTLKTAGFHHVTLTTADAVRSAGFYRQLLGLTLLKQTVSIDDAAHHQLYLGDQGGVRER